MRTRYGTMLAGLLWSVCLAVIGCGQPQTRNQAQLPGPARQALEKAYPGAKVHKVKSETEDGQRLYEVKILRDGSKLEVTLAENGTIVSVESPVAASDLPKAVSDAVAKAAPRAKVEKAEKTQSLADSRLNKLTTPRISYELEIEQNDRDGELSIAADGTVVEPLKWEKDLKQQEDQEEEDGEADDDGPSARASAAPSDDRFQSDFAVKKGNLADIGENLYFILKPGYRLTFQHGKDILTITVLDDTKVIDGVKTGVVEERETKHGQLAEVSRNYFAIDVKTKDVYYFGEDVDDYRDGKVIAHGGAWQSGVNGAKFGLMMPGQPRIGQKYYQEMAPNVAMDRAEVVGLSEVMTTPAGTFKNVLKTKESSPLELGSESKWYAPGVGLLKDGGFLLTKIDRH